MSAYAYRIVNVFTQGRAVLSGTPLCVFERAQTPDAERMQALALQFNLSTTTFTLPSERASVRVRIFTPGYEMPFAGHPTLGTAHVCRALGLGGDRLTLEMPAGIIPVRATGDRWTLQAKAPAGRGVEGPRPTLSAMLGLEEQDIGERPLWVNTGKEQLIVPLSSDAAVRRVRVRAERLAQLSSVDGHSMAYVFAPAGAGLLARFSSRTVAASSRIPPRGRRPPISAAGASRSAERCRASSRSRRASTPAGRRRCSCAWTPIVRST